MKKKLPNKLFYFGKIFFTVIILLFIFRKIDVTQLAASISKIKISTLLIISVFMIVKVFLEYKIWGYYLKINPDYISNRNEIFRSLLIGYSLRFLIPGGYAEVGKMYFVKNEKKHTFMSMGVEKFFQGWKTLLFASFAAIFYFRNNFIFPTILAFIIIIFLPFLLHLIKHFDRKKTFDEYFREYWKIIPKIFIIQILLMFITIFQYFFLLNNFLKFHIFSAIISIPLILFSNLIPITYAGLGLREKFAIEVLSKYDISSEVAVTASLTIFIINILLPALLGLYYIIKSKRKNK